MKALIIITYILISLASAVALVECSDESQFNQLQALEMGSSDHSDLITKTMVGFDNIISLDFQPKVEDITINEVSDNRSCTFLTENFNTTSPINKLG